MVPRHSVYHEQHVINATRRNTNNMNAAGATAPFVAIFPDLDWGINVHGDDGASFFRYRVAHQEL